MARWRSEFLLFLFSYYFFFSPQVLFTLLTGEKSLMCKNEIRCNLLCIYAYNIRTSIMCLKNGDWENGGVCLPTRKLAVIHVNLSGFRKKPIYSRIQVWRKYNTKLRILYDREQRLQYNTIYYSDGDGLRWPVITRYRRAPTI